MQRRHRRVAHFHGQVATRHHDAVAGAQDGLQVRNGLGALDLGDQARLVAVFGSGHVAQLTRHFHVGRVLGKAHRHVVGLKAHGRADVFHVLGREGGSREPTTLLIDALVVGQLTAQLDGGVHLFAAHRIHREHDQTVVEQQQVARLHVAGQLLVVQAHAVDVAWLGARSVQHELGTGFQKHLAVGKLAHADLGALQVGHDGHFAPGTLGGSAHRGSAINVVLRLAMAEVQPHHVDTRSDHRLEQLRVA